MPPTAVAGEGVSFAVCADVGHGFGVGLGVGFGGVGLDCGVDVGVAVERGVDPGLGEVRGVGLGLERGLPPERGLVEAINVVASLLKLLLTLSRSWTPTVIRCRVTGTQRRLKIRPCAPVTSSFIFAPRSACSC